MKTTWTPSALAEFEDEVAALFLAKRIRAPLHLYGGGEAELIEVFRQYVELEDWVLGGWRSHPHALLKGVEPEKLRAAILGGKSISLSFPEHRFLCSGIVGGVAPIAVGLGMAIKRKGEKHQVVCFLGDMSAESGLAYESIKYAAGHNLPVRFIVEDNGLSVATCTGEAWGSVNHVDRFWNVSRYYYTPTRPHVGVGKFVEF